MDRYAQGNIITCFLHMSIFIVDADIIYKFDSFYDLVFFFFEI